MNEKKAQLNVLLEEQGYEDYQEAEKEFIVKKKKFEELKPDANQKLKERVTNEFKIL